MKVTIPNSSLYLIIHKVHYKNDKYVKFKASLVSKYSQYVYECKNYKVNLDKFKSYIPYTGK